MIDWLVGFFFLFLPTVSVIATTCDANVTRRPGHARTGRPRTSRTVKSTADDTTPRTRSRTDRVATRRPPEERRKSVTVPVSTRRGAATAEGNDDKNTEPGTDPIQTDVKQKNKPSSAATSSSERIEEVTCQDVGISAEEMSTQQDTLKDTEKEMKTGTGPGTGTGPWTGTGTGTCTGAGPWPSNMPAKTLQPSKHKSSVFDIVEKKDDVPSEFEFDSVKRMQKMSREALTGGAAKSEVNVEPSKAAVPPKSPAKSPKPEKKKKKEKKVDKKKEEEVHRWNEAIARGNIFRPRKDDETVDEIQEEWGPPRS